MSVVVLMYHHILPKSGFISSSIEEFENQMKFLYENGYTTLSSEEFLKYKKGDLQVPKKSVFITFDDGWRDNYYYAYPILKKYNLKATVFIVTEWIEKASEKKEKFLPLFHKEAKRIIKTNPSSVVLNWDEIEKMRDLIDFHSHTHSHREFYFSKEYSWEEEFYLSKKIIKERLGFEDRHLCWPKGRYNKELLNKAKEYFEIFYTVKRGVNSPDGRLDEIKRIAVKNDEKWLKKQLLIFGNKFLGNLYSKIKPK